MTPVERGFCPRCLLNDTPGGEALARTIREQLAALPPEALCADDARAARLSACAACAIRSAASALNTSAENFFMTD